MQFSNYSIRRLPGERAILGRKDILHQSLLPPHLSAHLLQACFKAMNSLASYIIFNQPLPLWNSFINIANKETHCTNVQHVLPLLSLESHAKMTLIIYCSSSVLADLYHGAILPFPPTPRLTPVDLPTSTMMESNENAIHLEGSTHKMERAVQIMTDERQRTQCYAIVKE